MKKYELTENFRMCLGHKLFQIRALVTINRVVEAGEIGGYIEKEDNLSQFGKSWVSGNACVYGNAYVSGNSRVTENARVYDNAFVSGNVSVSGDVWVFGDAHLSGDAELSGDAVVFGNSQVSGKTRLHGNVQLSGDAVVSGDVHLSGDSHLSGNACVLSDSDVLQIKGLGTEHRTTTAYKTKDGIEIVCGCFRGGIEAFKERVLNTRSGKVREEYLKFVELIYIYFGL